MGLKNVILLQMLLFFCLKSSFSYTQSMGQEVIEIGAPIKEVPDLEEEPSAENEEDKVTSTTIQVATRKEFKKYSVTPNKKSKDVEKISGKKEEDEEAKIEKELADIYKDSIDYKADSSEVTMTPKENITEEEEKPIARVRPQFKFQPESGNPKDIARFRTSVDEISCNQNKLSGITKIPTSGTRQVIQDILFVSVLLFCNVLN